MSEITKITETDTVETTETVETTALVVEATKTAAIGIENETATGLFQVSTPDYPRYGRSFNILAEAKSYYDVLTSPKLLLKIVAEEEILLLEA